MYAIIGAMDEEVNSLHRRMQNVELKSIGPVDFMFGTLGNKEVVLLKSGIGLSMAAMSTSICLSHFKIDALINIGTAGGLKPEQNVLDIVVSDKITYHDFDITPFGNERNFSNRNRFVFKGDVHMMDIFKQLELDHPVWIGPLVSGNQFIHNDEQLATIEKFYPEAIAAEMEGAAIAHVCASFNCPFIVIRSLSDIAHNPQNNLTFDEYLLQASERSAAFTEAFVRLLDI